MSSKIEVQLILISVKKLLILHTKNILMLINSQCSVNLLKETC